METANFRPLLRAIAIAIVALGLAYYLHFYYDPSALQRIDSMAAAEVIARQRNLHQHSYTFHFFAVFVMGCCFLGAVEFIVYFLSLFIQRKPSQPTQPPGVTG